MKNSNVTLDIQDTKKTALKLFFDKCSFLVFTKETKEDTTWSPATSLELERDTAVKAARAILDYYNEY